MIIQWTYGDIYQDNSYGGGVQNYSGEAAAVLSYQPLKSLTLMLDSDLGMTLGLKGNTLPMSIATIIPTTEPPGGVGVVFYVLGGSLTIYVWDPGTSAWVS